MPIAVACSCGKRLQIRDELAGKQGKCPACGAVINIPKPTPAHGGVDDLLGGALPFGGDALSSGPALARPAALGPAPLPSGSQMARSSRRLLYILAGVGAAAAIVLLLVVVVRALSGPDEIAANSELPGVVPTPPPAAPAASPAPEPAGLTTTSSMPADQPVRQPDTSATALEAPTPEVPTLQGKTLQEWAAALDGTAAEARKQAVSALETAESGVFILALNHKDLAVRQSGLAVLNVANLDAEAVPALIEAWHGMALTTFQDKEKQHVNRQFLAAFKRMGPKAAPGLRDAWRDDDPASRKQIIALALSELGADAKVALPVLIKAVREENGLVRYPARTAIAKIGPEAVAAVPALLESLERFPKDGYWDYAFVSIGADAVPHLSAALKNENAAFRSSVLTYLSMMRGNAKAAIPVLRELLSDKVAHIRVEAATTLWDVSADPEAPVRSLVESLKDADGAIRYLAAKALWRVEPAAKTAIPALRAMLGDSHGPARMAAAGALLCIDNQKELAVPILNAGSNSNDNATKDAAVKTFYRIAEIRRASYPPDVAKRLSTFLEFKIEAMPMERVFASVTEKCLGEVKFQFEADADALKQRAISWHWRGGMLDMFLDSLGYQFGFDWRIDGNTVYIKKGKPSVEQLLAEIDASPGTPRAKAARMEKVFRDNPDFFSPNTRNSLRHLYASFDQRKAYEQSDIILQYSIMDDYTMSIMAEWQVGKDDQKAIESLQKKLKMYPKLKFLAVACNLKIGDIYATTGDNALAKQHYDRAAKLAAGPTMGQYRHLIEQRLARLK